MQSEVVVGCSADYSRKSYSLHHRRRNGTAVLDGSQRGGQVGCVRCLHHLLVSVHNIQVPVELLAYLFCQLENTHIHITFMRTVLL